MAATIANVRQRPTERRDLWWLEPLAIVIGLGGFIVYSFFVSIANANYYVEPYLSPFYSPCIAANCIHPTLPIIGSWWNLSPALLVVGSPVAFRATCYYFRRAYYRSFFMSPPACAVPDARKTYSGETKFPFVLQNIHRYALYLAALVIGIHWIDLPHAFSFAAADGTHHFGIGLGSIILTFEVVLLTGYVASCHAARYLVGGYLDSFHKASLRFRLWSLSNRLNPNHAWWGWLSLIPVIAGDAYIRLLAAGVLIDPRIVF
jgi:hypothetical protein